MLKLHDQTHTPTRRVNHASQTHASGRHNAHTQTRMPRRHNTATQTHTPTRHEAIALPAHTPSRRIFNALLAVILVVGLMPLASMAFMSTTNNAWANSAGNLTLDQYATDAVMEQYIVDNLDAQYIESANEVELVNGLVVKNTLFDGTLVKASDTIASVMGAIESEGKADDLAKFIAQISGVVAVYNLNEESDFYVAYANTMFEDAAATVQDWCFALNDLEGVVLNDCVYDTQTGLVYIPKNAFYDEDGAYIVGRIQVQFMQVMGTSVDTMTSEVCSSVVENNSADVYQMVENIFRMETTVSVEPYLNEDDMLVCVNGIPIDDDTYTYNASTGQITLDESSAAVQSVSVTVEEKSVLDNMTGMFLPERALAETTTVSGMEFVNSEPIELPRWVCVGTSLLGNAAVTYAGTSMQPFGSSMAYSPGSYAALDESLEKIFSWVLDGGGSVTADTTVDRQTECLYFKVALNNEDHSCYFSNGTYQTMTGNTVAYYQFDGNATAAGVEAPADGTRIEGLNNLGDLVMECADVGATWSNGQDSTWSVVDYDWAWKTVQCRFMYLDNDYAVIAMCCSRLDGQAAVGLFKLRVNPPSGYAQLVKSSADSGITGENVIYSLAGAEYGIYTDEACTAEIATLTTDEYGNSNTVELDTGTYWVKEKYAPSGYNLDTQTYRCDVVSQQTTTVYSTEEPVYSSTFIRIKKYTSGQDWTSTEPLAGASFAGAYYNVDFYAAEYDTVGQAEASGDPTRNWVFRTDEDGFIRLDNATDYYVSGDALYEHNGSVVFPLGTYVIYETQAPVGYVCSDAEYLVRIVGNGEVIGDVIEDENELLYVTDLEPVIRGDFRFQKEDGSSKRLANCVFAVTSNTTGEYHIIATDQNGEFSSTSDFAKHSFNTNINDEAVIQNDNGTFTIQDESAISYANGIWFYGTQSDGQNVNDNRGALPFDTYTIDELRCSANAGYNLLTDIKLVITRFGYEVDLGTFTDTDAPELTIATVALDADDGDKYVTPGESSTIVDTLAYSNAEPGTTYTAQWTLTDTTTYEVIASDEVEFVPTESEGTTTINIDADTTELDGHTLAISETLKDENNEVVATHNDDLSSTNQIMHVSAPSISTTATDSIDGDHEIIADKTVRIVDTIAYENVDVGKEYTLVGTLNIQSSGEPLLASVASDSDEQTRTPETSSEESEENQSELDNESGSELTDETDSEPVSDLDSEYASTLGSDEATESENDPDSENASEEEFDESTTLTDKTKTAETDGAGTDDQSEQTTVTSSTTFTPTEESGTEEVTFEFDASALAGETIVVFETLYCDGEEVATHTDINDKAQSVDIVEPSIHTLAADSSDGDKNVAADSNSAITDTITYSDVKAGEETTVVGILMSRETGLPMLFDQNAESIDTDTLEDFVVALENGEDVFETYPELANMVAINSLTFVPESTSGDVDVTFNVDTSALDDTDVVVFEYLFKDDNLIANHTDIEDGNQTIHIGADQPTTTESITPAAVGSTDSTGSAGSPGSTTTSYPGSGTTTTTTTPTQGSSLDKTGQDIACAIGIIALVGGAAALSARYGLRQYQRSQRILRLRYMLRQ